MGVAITGLGVALPERVVTNDDFAKYLDTSDQWITERTGIHERRFGGTTGELATEAGRNALKDAGVDASEIDLVLLATSTPDAAMPPTAAWVHAQLGVKGGVADINVACAGFVYALSAAQGMILGGLGKVLVIGADTLSRITDQQDRSTAVLFGDGAGAVVVEKTEGDNQLLAADLLADGSLTDILRCNTGGTIKMRGQEVYKAAVLLCTASIKATLQTAGLQASDIDVFVPHQANVRIIDAISTRVGIAPDAAAIALDKTGNTSAASIPLALGVAAEQGRLKDGAIVLLCGFGAGMTIGTQIWRWGK